MCFMREWKIGLAQRNVAPTLSQKTTGGEGIATNFGEDTLKFGYSNSMKWCMDATLIVAVIRSCFILFLSNFSFF